jgi:hypothetical protein
VRGRKKNAVKKEARQGLSNLKKWQLDVYADGYDSRAAMIVEAINEAILLEGDFEQVKEIWPGSTNPRMHLKAREERHRIAWKLLTEAFSQSWKSGEAAVFRNMAEIIERQKHPVDPARACVGKLINASRRPVSPREARRALEDGKIPVSDKTVGRIVKHDYGVKSAPGRPRK